MRSNFAVVIPAYNEAGNILRVAAATNARLAEAAICADLVFVNDGSSDSTQEEIEEARTAHPNIVGLRHATNRGYGDALRTGFAYVCGDDRYIFAFVMDADLTMDPKFIRSFYEKVVKDGYDFVIGSRYSDGGHMENVHFARRVISRTSAIVSHVCFRLPIRDYTLGFRAIRTSLLGQLTLKERGFPILIEQVYCALGHTSRFASVPIVLTGREVGESRFQFTPPVFMRYLTYALKALIRRRSY